MTLDKQGDFIIIVIMNELTYEQTAAIIGLSYNALMQRRRRDYYGDSDSPLDIIQYEIDERQDDIVNIIRRFNGFSDGERIKQPASPVHSDRNQEIQRLRFSEGWTLKRIGDEFDLSRERVRQIVGNTGYLASKIMAESIADASPDLSNEELSEIYGVSKSTVNKHRNGRHVVSGDAPVSVGVEYERWAAERLAELGYSAELQKNGAKFDILVDGKLKIDVKSSSGAFRTERQVNPQYNFGVNKKEGKDRVDFFFCIAIDTEDIFIIPYDVLPMPKLSLIFCWPTARPKIGKYQKYHNRFDLIEAALKD